MTRFNSKTLSTSQHSLARSFEKYALCTYSQAVKAFNRDDSAQIAVWTTQLDEKTTQQRMAEDFEKIKADYYAGRYGDMSLAEYAYADATFAADKIIPGSRDVEETTWTSYCLAMHTNDFSFTSENQEEYRRLFKQEYARRYEVYFEDAD